MAAQEPVWSFGQIQQYTSSGTTTDPDSGGWSYGQVAQQHEYVAAGGSINNEVLIKISNLDKYVTLRGVDMSRLRKILNIDIAR